MSFTGAGVSSGTLLEELTTYLSTLGLLLLKLELLALSSIGAWLLVVGAEDDVLLPILLVRVRTRMSIDSDNESYLALYELVELLLLNGIERVVAA